MRMNALRFEIMAGATGLEPVASCMTGRRSNFSEAGCANVMRIIENYRAKGVLLEETTAA